MKKFIQLFLACMLMTLFCCSAAYAESSFDTSDTKQGTRWPRLIDDGHVLKALSRSNLLATLDEISENNNFDVVVVTISDFPSEYTYDEYAAVLYDHYGFGMGGNRDGCILVFNKGISQCNWGFYANGYGERAFTDASFDYIRHEMTEAGLDDKRYHNVFLKFANLCDMFVKKAKSGKPYDSGNLPRETSGDRGFRYILLLALIFGCVPVIYVMMEMASLEFEDSPHNDMKNHSINITDSYDVFLFSQRVCTPHSSYGDDDDNN